MGITSVYEKAIFIYRLKRHLLYINIIIAALLILIKWIEISAYFQYGFSFLFAWVFMEIYYEIILFVDKTYYKPLSMIVDKMPIFVSLLKIKSNENMFKVQYD
jgi:hypothetical protein